MRQSMASAITRLFIASALGVSSGLFAVISSLYDADIGSVGLNVQTIQALTVTAPSAVSLIINSANPGTDLASVVDTSSTYAISSNISTALSVSGSQIPAGINFYAQLGLSGSLSATGTILLKSAAGAGGGTITLFPTINAGVYSGSVTYTAGAPVTTNPLVNTSFQLPYTLQ